jgi:hypothetical protein
MQLLKMRVPEMYLIEATPAEFSGVLKNSSNRVMATTAISPSDAELFNRLRASNVSAKEASYTKGQLTGLMSKIVPLYQNYINEDEYESVLDFKIPMAWIGAGGDARGCSAPELLPTTAH